MLLARNINFVQHVLSKLAGAKKYQTYLGSILGILLVCGPDMYNCEVCNHWEVLLTHKDIKIGTSSKVDKTDPSLHRTFDNAAVFTRSHMPTDLGYQSIGKQHA